jgi:serine O-acetyltransferase
MHRTIQADLFRYSGTPAGLKTFWKGLRIPGFRFTYALRQAKRHSKYTPLGILFRLLVDRYYWKYGFQIPMRAEIGEGLYIGHIGNIVVNGDCRIGSNCNLAPGVTLGATNRGSKKGCPTLGDRVWVGANAAVVGGITIGNNVLIAPGAYVNFDVPDDSIVIGNPGKVIPSQNATQGYVEFILEP